MANEIGKNIKQVCEVLQKHGAMKACHIAKHLQHTPYKHVHQYLQRTIMHDVVMRKNNLYVVSPSWSDDLQKVGRKKDRDANMHVCKPVINSVWSLANV